MLDKKKMASLKPDNYDFVKQLPEELNCSICSSLLAVPVQIECCGILYCETCLQEWLKKGKTCPHCRSTDLKYIKDRRIQRQIDELSIYCPKRSKGCKKITTVSKCSSHLKTCSYEKVSCSNNCGSRILRNKLKKHLGSECCKRLVNCEYCNERGMYENISSLNHYIKCPSFPLDCPNNCGHDKIQRKDLPDHQKECPLEPVKCPFFEAGCKQEIPRKELAAHKAANMDHHLELTLTTATSTSSTSQLKTIKDELEATKHSLKQVSMKFDGLASCMTKQLATIHPTLQDAAILYNIKTTIEAMTSMLEKGKKYCLPLVTTEGIIYSKRTPSFYLTPGYKMYINSSNNIILEKGEHDNRLEWPMPNMQIEHRKNDNILLGTLTICTHCGVTVNQITGEHQEIEIGSLSPFGLANLPVTTNEVFIKVTEHICLGDMSNYLFVGSQDPFGTPPFLNYRLTDNS